MIFIQSLSPTLVGDCHVHCLLEGTDVGLSLSPAATFPPQLERSLWFDFTKTEGVEWRKGVSY